MTYSANHQLLAPVAKALDADAMGIFCKAANDASNLGYDHNACVTSGWDAVKKNYERPAGGGKWAKKAEPAPIDDELAEKLEKCVKIEKVDDSLGLVFGWAIVCTEDGEDYIDTQNDHIPEDAMMKALADFSQNSRVAKDMHSGDPIGDIVFMYPLTADISKAMGITCNKTGAMIAMKPSNDVLAKFKSGEYTGFSIGGVLTDYVSGVVS